MSVLPACSGGPEWGARPGCSGSPRSRTRLLGLAKGVKCTGTWSVGGSTGKATCVAGTLSLRADGLAALGLQP